MKTKDVGKRFIHLTNFSVNKRSKKFVKNTKEEKDGEGSKWSLTALKKHYESMGVNSDKVCFSLFSFSIRSKKLSLKHVLVLSLLCLISTPKHSKKGLVDSSYMVLTS